MQGFGVSGVEGGGEKEIDDRNSLCESRGCVSRRDKQAI